MLIVLLSKIPSRRKGTLLIYLHTTSLSLDSLIIRSKSEAHLPSDLTSLLNRVSQFLIQSPCKLAEPECPRMNINEESQMKGFCLYCCPVLPSVLTCHTVCAKYQTCSNAVSIQFVVPLKPFKFPTLLHDSNTGFFSPHPTTNHFNTRETGKFIDSCTFQHLQILQKSNSSLSTWLECWKVAQYTLYSFLIFVFLTTSPKFI